MKEEIYYCDKNNNLISNENASNKCIMRNTNEEGELVSEVFGGFNNEEPYNITKKEYDELVSRKYELGNFQYKIIIE